MRLILDANVVASGIFWSGPPSEILRRWIRGKEALLVSVPILVEYREVLARMAVGGRAQAIVSGDKDLLVLKEVRGLRSCRHGHSFHRGAVDARSAAVMKTSRRFWKMIRKRRAQPTMSLDEARSRLSAGRRKNGKA